MALEGLTRCEKCRMRAAVTQRNAKPLRAANRDVRAEFPWWPQQRETQQIRPNRHQRACRMRLLDETRVIVNLAERIRILDQRPEDVLAKLKCFMIADRHLDA